MESKLTEKEKNPGGNFSLLLEFPFISIDVFVNQTEHIE
jgi:hypothetical protein